LHILAPALDSLPWLQLDPNARTEAVGELFCVTFKVEADGRKVVRQATHPHPCKAYALARFLAADEALRGLPEHRARELESLGHSAAWRRPGWLGEEDPR
jgi:hypothetical protein